MGKRDQKIDLQVVIPNYNQVEVQSDTGMYLKIFNNNTFFLVKN